MKQTQLAILKYLQPGSRTFKEIGENLKKLYPNMRTGLNYYNINGLLGTLLFKGLIKHDDLNNSYTYCLTKKGIAELNSRGYYRRLV